MAWSSIASCSRQLAIALRSQTPRNAVAKFHQGKRLMSEKGLGGKGPVPDMLKQFQDAFAEKTNAVKQKLSSSFEPYSEKFNELQSSTKMGLLAAGPVTLLIGSIYYFTQKPESKPNKKEEVNRQRLPNTTFMLPHTPSLVNLQTQNSSIPNEDLQPCVPCAVDPYCEKESEGKTGPCEEETTACIVASENGDETAEALIPEEVSHVTASQAQHDTEDEKPTKRRRRKSKAVVEDDEI